MTVDEIATEALAIESDAERDAFVHRACGDDGDKRDRVAALLQALRQTEDSSFLASGLFGASKPDDAPEPVPAVADEERFELRAQHALGGLGEVWIAWDRQLRREVALKRIRPEWEYNSEAAARFRREAEITGYLEHPGVVPIYALGNQSDGRPFYAMQFIRGKTLDEVAAESLSKESGADDWHDSDSLRKLLDHFTDVCQTLDYAHSRSVVHRDLKPANIMLGEYGQTLVVDWGLAKVIDGGQTHIDEPAVIEPARLAGSGTGNLAITQIESADGSDDQTRHGTAMGTPRYMSPEQAAGDLEAIGPATDIYCLGATLYFLLTGRPPHAGDEDLPSTLKRIMAGDFDRPLSLRSRIPKPLEAIVLKAMATKPSDRYETAGKLADDVRRYLADQSVSVFRDPVSEHVFRWMRRHRAATASIVVGLFLAFGGIIAAEEIRRELERRESVRIEEKRDADERLRQEQNVRRLEALATIDSARQRSDLALADSRYADAAALLEVAIGRASELPELAQQTTALRDQRDRLERLGRFDSLSLTGHDLDFLSRDTEAAILLQQALTELGVWESDAWWQDLPDQDLSAEQRDRLRWSVYRVFIALSSIHSTKMVVVMGGGSEGMPSTYRMLRSYLVGTAGMREAKATVEICNRIQLFRPSELARWIKSLAVFRLKEGQRVDVATLGPPQNAVDGGYLSTCSLIASVDPAYRIWFKDYGATFFDEMDQPEESKHLAVALDVLRRISDESSGDYFARLKLTKVYFMYAEKAESAGRTDEAIEYYELARAEIGRCIAIRPRAPFGHADRSTIALRQAILMRDPENASENDRRRAEELLDVSMRDANHAQRLAPEDYWVYWHIGATALEMGQTQVAVDAFFDAVELGFDFQNTTDVPIVLLDDYRGRKTALRFANDENASIPQATRQTLLASLEYVRGNTDSAYSRAKEVLAEDPRNARARRIAGWCSLSEGNLDESVEHFEVGLREAPGDIILMVGLATTLSQLSATDHGDRILELYRGVLDNARSRRQRSTAHLGIATVFLLTGDDESSLDSIAAARQLDPGCDVTPLVRLTRDEARRLLKQSKRTKDAAAKQVAIDRIRELSQFLNEISSLPAASAQQIIDAAQDEPPSSLAILNHDFELPIETHWDSGGDFTLTRVELPDEFGNHVLAARPGRSGWVRQTVPAPSGGEYRLSLSVRSGDGGGRIDIRVLQADAVLSTASVTEVPRKWSRHSVPVTIPKSEEILLPVTVEISLSTGSGRIMLDEVALDRIDAADQP